jgi:hypothetical protein
MIVLSPPILGASKIAQGRPIKDKKAAELNRLRK